MPLVSWTLTLPWYNSALGDAQYAPIKPLPTFTGPIGQWKTITSLPISRYLHTSVANNNYLYAVGGKNCNYNDFSGSLLNDVWYARIGSDGTIGNWNSTVSLPNGLVNHASVVLNGYLYVIGGFTGTCSSGSSTDTVLYAKINAQDTTPPITTANPGAGCYLKPIDVTLICNDGNGSGCDKTYFTTDGSKPTTSSPVYTGPIHIDKNTTLKFFSRDLAGNFEEITQIEYDLNSAIEFNENLTSHCIYWLYIVFYKVKHSLFE